MPRFGDTGGQCARPLFGKWHERHGGTAPLAAGDRDRDQSRVRRYERETDPGGLPAMEQHLAPPDEVGQAKLTPWRCEKCNGILAWVYDEEARCQGADIVLKKDGKAAMICPFCCEPNVWHPASLDKRMKNSL